MSESAYLTLLLCLGLSNLLCERALAVTPTLGPARSNTGTGSGSGQSTVTPGPDERLRVFLEKHSNKSLDMKDIRNHKGSGLALKSICTEEESILPASVMRGSYLSHQFSFKVYTALIADFALFLEQNMVSLRTQMTNEDWHSPLFATNNPQVCALSQLGLDVVSNKELGDLEKTVMPCSVITMKEGNADTFHCICRKPTLGTSADKCMTLLQSFATSEKVTLSVTSLEDLPIYPTALGMSRDEIILLEENTRLVCRDSQLKLKFLELFQSYEKLTAKIEQITVMFEVSIPILTCNHDLAGLSYLEMLAFLDCVKSHSSKPRDKRDLLSVLGLRQDLSGWTRHTNEAIAAQFSIVQQNEQKIVKQLRAEQNAIDAWMNKESKNADMLASQLSYLQAIFSSGDRLQHHRRSLISSLDSLVYSFDKLTDDLRQILQLTLSVTSHNPIVCEYGDCIERESIILKKTESEITILAREARIESESVYRLSCYLFKLGSQFYVHSLNDAALLMFGGTYVDRATNMQIGSDCISQHIHCPGQPVPVQNKHLIQGNLYLSIHSGTLMAQCLENETLVTVHNNVSCTLAEPAAVTLPFLHRDRMISSQHTHYFIAGMREQKALTAAELNKLEHDSKRQQMTINQIWSQYKAAPLDLKNETTLVTYIVALAAVSLIVVLMCCCCCPSCLQNLSVCISGAFSAVVSQLWSLLVNTGRRAFGRPPPSPGSADTPVATSTPMSTPSRSAVAPSAASFPGESPVLPPPLARSDAFSYRNVNNQLQHVAGNPGSLLPSAYYNTQDDRVRFRNPFPHNCSQPPTADNMYPGSHVNNLQPPKGQLPLHNTYKQ